ncbi:hypothetical protein [Dyadobacter alkalitolerans]|uniref:hypothetical protein n=1 Tax=Dyadobacter alkalitolerans TaxID=492736 RepID=UPI00047A201E|nr:hypothetical protein [Dyadobacter alkalitolerans]
MRAPKLFVKLLAKLCALLVLAMGILWWMTCHERTIATDNHDKGHIIAFKTLGDLVQLRPFRRPYYQVTAINDGPYMFVGYHLKENILVYGSEPASGYSSYGVITPKQLDDIISKLPNNPKWENIHKIISAYPRPGRVPSTGIF